jgi:hypothetical protein
MHEGDTLKYPILVGVFGSLLPRKHTCPDFTKQNPTLHYDRKIICIIYKSKNKEKLVRIFCMQRIGGEATVITDVCTLHVIGGHRRAVTGRQSIIHSTEHKLFVTSIQSL